MMNLLLFRSKVLDLWFLPLPLRMWLVINGCLSSNATVMEALIDTNLGLCLRVVINNMGLTLKKLLVLSLSHPLSNLSYLLLFNLIGH